MALEEIQWTDFTKALKEIVEQNLDNEDFSIDQLCKEMGLSRTHLHRKLKASANLSTSLFIRKIRLHKARELLENSDFNISEIAYQTGNKSPQNFSKYFIEEFGVSPSQYRKQWLEAHKETIVGQTNGIAQVPPDKVDKPGQRFNSKLMIRSLIVTTGLLLIVLFGFQVNGGFFYPKADDPDPSSDELPSIAVIPFQNYGLESEDFFSEGVVEDILTFLAQIDGWRVISRTSTSKYANTDKTIQQIGTELNVRYILEGSVRQDSHQVFITAQLIRVSDDKHLWAERYERPKNNVIDIQTEVAKSIARALNQSISSKAQQKLAHRPTENIEAYTAFLRGRHLLRSRKEEDLYKSLDQFKTALALDSVYAEAYIGMAKAYYLISSLRYETQKADSYNKLAEKFALMAIKHDKENGGGYAILGNLYADQYRWEEAISAYEIALDLNPNDALINYWYSLMLRSIGKLDKSLAYHQVASELDPLHPVVQAGYIYTCGLAGAFDLAEQILQKVEPVLGGSFLYYAAKGHLLLQKGDYEAAVPVCSKALELNPTFKPSESDRFYCLGKLGESGEVTEYIAGLDTTQALDCLRAAKAYLSLDEKARSLEMLSKAASLGLVPDDILANPIFLSIYSHPDYIAILRQFNLYSYYQPQENLHPLSN